MTQTDNPPSAPHSFSVASRLFWAVLIAVTLYISYFQNLGAVALIGPDEPRYAWIARSMAETSDWVTPRLYGNPWFEKPVLYYWGAALSFKLFGVSEVTARLPSALAALFATLAMAWLAWRSCGAETARWLLLLLPTSVGMIGFSHAAATDMPFAAMLAISTVCAAVILGLLKDPDTPALPRTPWLSLLLFGFFLGLATLAKGPAALLLSGGAILLWAALTRRWRDSFRCLHPVAIAAFFLTALPWYILCARRNPDFFRIFIIEHNFQRYLTPEFQHLQPFWFYLPVLLIALVPWTFVLLWAAFFGLRTSFWKNRANSLNFFLLCFATFCIAFFSLSQSKLPGYVLPAIPAIAFLSTRAYIALGPPRHLVLQRLLTGFAVLSLLVGLALILFSRRFQTPHIASGAWIVSGCVLLAFALANLLLTLKTQKQGSWLAPLAVLPVLLLILMFPALSRPWLLQDPSGKSLAAEMEAAQLPVGEIYAASMNRGQQYSLSFYLHREVRTWDPDKGMEGYLMARARNCDSLVKFPMVCVGNSVQLKSGGWLLYRVGK